MSSDGSESILEILPYLLLIIFIVASVGGVVFGIFYFGRFFVKFILSKWIHKKPTTSSQKELLIVTGLFVTMLVISAYWIWG